jgi:hypothetical protein
MGPEPESYLPFGRVSESSLETSICNLERIEVVGLTERFDASLEILRHRFGWTDLAYRRLNVTDARPALEEIDGPTLDLIREVNRFDVALYRHASELFVRQVSAATAAITRGMPRNRPIIHIARWEAGSEWICQEIRAGAPGRVIDAQQETQEHEPADLDEGAGGADPPCAKRPWVVVRRLPNRPLAAMCGCNGSGRSEAPADRQESAEHEHDVVMLPSPAPDVTEEASVDASGALIVYEDDLRSDPHGTLRCLFDYCGIELEEAELRALVCYARGTTARIISSLSP